MSNANSPLINPADIVLGTAVIIDARSGPDAFERYSKSHLTGALHADLDRDLSQKPKDAAVGGRHPLPELKAFAAFLGMLGIGPATSVIVYDDKGGANAAARFWWMLRALGHQSVRVVNGGWDAINKQGLPVTSEKSIPAATAPYPANAWKWPVATIEKVAAAAADPDSLVIDVREAYRYRGESEPIDLVAGHIPGAVNVPFVNNLSADGSFLSSQALAAQYEEVLNNRKTEKVIVHCGSGVTACHTLLALEEAGIKGANLYVGSWSEWSRNDKPVATGDK